MSPRFGLPFQGLRTVVTREMRRAVAIRLGDRAPVDGAAAEFVSMARAAVAPRADGTGQDSAGDCVAD
jgi:hypothetical protein